MSRSQVGKERGGRQRWRILPGHAEVIFFIVYLHFNRIHGKVGIAETKTPEKPTTQRRGMGASSPQPDST